MCMLRRGEGGDLWGFGDVNSAGKVKERKSRRGESTAWCVFSFEGAIERVIGKSGGRYRERCL